MNKISCVFLSLCLMGSSGLALAQGAMDKNSMSMEKKNTDSMDKGSMGGGSMKKEDMDKGMMKQDSMPKDKMDKKTGPMKKHKQKMEAPKEQGSMQRMQ